MKHIILSALLAAASAGANAQFVVEMKNGSQIQNNGNIIFTPDSEGNNFSIGDTYTADYDLSNISSISRAPLATAHVGDYFYSDGTYSPTLDAAKSVIGVIFWVGNPSAGDEALATDYPGCTHGLVVGLKERQTEWQEYYEDTDETVNDWIEDNTDFSPIYDGYGVNAVYNHIAGYNNTMAIEAYNDEFVWDYEVVAVGGIDFLMDSYTAPENTSGWYLPAAKEMSLIISGPFDGDIDDIGYLDNPPLENLTLINSRLSAIDGAQTINGVYWTSNEVSRMQAMSIRTANGLLMETSKGGSNAIRPILAF